MAPTRLEKDRRLKSILGMSRIYAYLSRRIILMAFTVFAAEVESRLLIDTPLNEATTLSRELEKQIYSFPGAFGTTANPRCDEIDGLGTRIWNLCTRRRRQHEKDAPNDTLLILLLACIFAFLLLDFAHQCDEVDGRNIFRLMKIGIKAGRNCLGQE
jgi:hypothetical protein